MIQLTQAALLGIVQGLTEFIPVSSTAHLRVIPALLGLPDPGAAFSAVIQLGTLIALVAYFWNDLGQFATASIQGLLSGHPFEEERARMFWYMGLGTIPICIFGLAFSAYIKSDLRSLYIIASSLIFFAALLFAADRWSKRYRTITEFNLRDALLVGLAQSIALIPGASRSGTTLSMGIFLGYTREASLRISFLLSIPAVAISGFYELYKERQALIDAGLSGVVVATIVSAAVGYLAIAFLFRFLKNHSTVVFVVYRLILGLVLFFLLKTGYLDAH